VVSAAAEARMRCRRRQGEVESMTLEPAPSPAVGEEDPNLKRLVEDERLPFLIWAFETGFASLPLAQRQSILSRLPPMPRHLLCGSPETAAKRQARWMVRYMLKNPNMVESLGEGCG
jgi:hypothetical protein